MPSLPADLSAGWFAVCHSAGCRHLELSQLLSPCRVCVSTHPEACLRAPQELWRDIQRTTEQLVKDKLQAQRVGMLRPAMQALFKLLHAEHCWFGV